MNRKLKKYKKILNRNRNRRKKLDKFLKLYKLYPILFIFVTLFIVIAAISAIVLAVANWEWFELKSKNELGDAFGGLTNPIIAFIGVIVTFLAFYIQYKFNLEQSKLIAIQRKERLDDIEKSDKYSKREYFDKKFYELLKMHNANVDNLTIKHINGEIIGRQCFDKFIEEIHLYTLMFDKFRSQIKTNRIVESEVKSDLKNAYLIFFYGIRNQLSLQRFDNEDYIKEVKSEIFVMYNYSLSGHYGAIESQINRLNIDVTGINLPVYYFNLGDGYHNQLSLYFRFLFMLVKFVVDEDEKIIDYKSKREYLKIVRTQLSNAEQQLIFYNWYVGMGSNWENDKNKFLTDYRIIHNIDIFKIYQQIPYMRIFFQMKKNIKKLHEDDDFLEAEKK